MQCRQVTFLNPETRPEGRDIEQIKNLADREAAVGKLEQMLQGDQQRIAATLPLIGQGEGDET